MATKSKNPADSVKEANSKIEISRELANAAKVYDWDKVLHLLYANPELINATRPGGKSWYTPLHQAAHGGAQVAVVQRMLALGASTTQRTANGDRAVDIARQKGHEYLIKLLEPVEKMAEEPLVLHFPPEIVEAQMVCAFRFLGYEYEQAMGLSDGKYPGSGLIDLFSPVVRDLYLYEDDNRNFATFFMLQEYLHRWHSDHHTKYASEHVAYDFLFLQLYRQEPPARFRHAEYCERWRGYYGPRAEGIAALVRQSFRRVGSGQKGAS